MIPGRLFILIAALLALRPDSIRAEGEAYLLAGDPQEGMKVFFDKECAACHSAFGGGTKSAPDLGKTPVGHLSAAQMAGTMWNHAPEMWAAIKDKHIDPAPMSQEEMADLFAFLYSVRYLDEPGNPDRGQALLAEKGCLECHALQGRGGQDAPDLSEAMQHADPVIWVQAMWNHTLQMGRSMEERGIAWPEFRDGDILDIFAYIRSVAPPPKTRISLRPANPQAGEALFSQKGCSNCHALGGQGGRSGPDLGEKDTEFPRTFVQFTGRMWNHAPEMWKGMDGEQIEQMEFSGREMSDLIAYLYSVRLAGGSGDTAAGAQVFAAKNCHACHTIEPLDAESRAEESPTSPVALARALWNHGIQMFAQMQERGIPWSEFEEQEILDLIAFLRAVRISWEAP